MRKKIRRAILDGASQIAVPAFVSTLAICIVFVPVAFLTGPAAYLFTPLALAVAFAMLASYFLSRTLVPTMVLYLLPKEIEAEEREAMLRQAAQLRPPPAPTFGRSFVIRQPFTTPSTAGSRVCVRPTINCLTGRWIIGWRRRRCCLALR